MIDFLRRHAFHNIGLKLLSLALAVALWLAVARDPVDEVPIEVPIEFHRMPDNLEISSEHIPKAQILLRGPERLIHRLQPIDVHAEIDLGHVTTAGERTFDLSSHQIQKPHDLEVVQVIPSQFQLEFDHRASREVEIKPRVMGTFAPGRQIGTIEVSPSRILISGPQKHVEAVESAITDPVDVSGIILRGSFVTHAYVSDPLVQVVHPEPVRVTVTMEKVALENEH
ncbi:MAG TPA: CdaR family protein [Terriglobales bacterium]|nr:CdaR family protein [Terriglobales bacterium]